MGEKQYPNTSTPSYPHTSNSTPGQVHVDIEHRGSDSKVESQTKHVTDPGMVNLGRLRQESNESSDSGGSGK